MFFAVSNTFFDRTNDVASFTNPNANLAFFVTDHDDGAEAQLLTTFDDLSNSTNLNDPLLPVCFFLFSTRFFTTICHASPASLHQSESDKYPMNSYGVGLQAQPCLPSRIR